jgi:hypothetical protein
MKITMKSKFLHILCAAGTAMALPASAAVITWGGVQTITGASDIDTTGLDNIGGANFGLTTGTTTTVTGTTGGLDVDFKSLAHNQSVALSNGITVAPSAAWIPFGTNDSALSGNFGTVMDRSIGLESGATFSSTITLSGLVDGTQYRIQFFTDSTGNNTQTISGSANMNSLNGQFVTGTFTADATTQVLTVGYTSGEFATASALTIGEITVIPEPSAALLGALGLLGLLRRRRN